MCALSPAPKPSMGSHIESMGSAFVEANTARGAIGSSLNGAHASVSVRWREAMKDRREGNRVAYSGSDSSVQHRVGRLCSCPWCFIDPDRAAIGRIPSIDKPLSADQFEKSG